MASGNFICDLCHKEFKWKSALDRHRKTHEENPFQCSKCAYSTNRSDNYTRHANRVHSTTVKSPQNAPTPSAPTPSTAPPKRRPSNRPSSSETIELMKREIESLHVKIQEMEQKQLSDNNKRKRKSDDTRSSHKRMRLEPGDGNSSNDEPGASTEATEITVPEEEDLIRGNDNVEAQDDQIPGPSWQAPDYVEINPITTTLSERMKSKQAEYVVKIDPAAFDIEVINLENFQKYQHKLTEIFRVVLDKARSTAPLNARGWISIDFENLKDKRGKWHRHINTRYTDIHQITVEDLMFEIERTLNSDQSINISNGFKVFIIFTEMPSGGARHKSSIGSFEERTIYDPNEWRKRKRSLIDPAENAPEGDKLCLARCLTVGQFIADQGEQFVNADGYKNLVDSRKPLQEKRARELHRLAEVPTEKLCGLEQVHKFQQLLSDYQIIIYTSHGITEIIYPNQPITVTRTKQIYLWLYDEHFCLINPNMMAGFIGTDYFCHKCQQSWDSSPKHACENAICKLCKLPNCLNENGVPSQEPIHCNNCNRDWPTRSCKLAHDKNLCKREAKCLKCLAKVPRAKLEPPELHHCMLNWCLYCSEFKESGHTQCFVQKPKRHQEPPEEVDPNLDDIYRLYGEEAFNNGYAEQETQRSKKKKKTQEKSKLIMADIESEIDPELRMHSPILLCMKSADGTKKWTYRGENCVDLLIKDHVEKDEFYNTTLVFHNLAGYDGMFVLKALFSKALKPNAIFRSSKVLTMKLKQRKVRFLDSLLHVNMALSRLPAAYNFEGQAVKGYFPILLATKANRGYVGPFPEMKYFDPGNMSKKAYKVFKRWYDEEKAKYDADPNLQYDLDAEMLKYCEADVEVLRLGFQKYRETYMAIFDGIDPADFITLPSYINHCYRTLAMPKDSIAILPPRGYNTTQRQSNAAICWLEWECHKLKKVMKHARNSCEVKIGPYYVDGFIDGCIGEKGKVYEFYGCKFHGCTICQRNRLELFKGKTIEDRFQDTMNREQFIRDSGYEVISIFECQFWKQVRQNKNMSDFVMPLRKKMFDYAPLCPRDALRGGRTNALRMSYEPKEGEALFYKDFTSLYPATNMCVHGQKFPIGHPHIYLHSFPDVNDIFGLAKVVVKPPEKLFLPVLPVFSNGKVIFGLCGTCIANNNNTEKCTHQGKDRYITDTFVTVELQKALECGYEIIEMIELWQWPEEQRSGDLFKTFMTKSYIQKVEASGWPKKYTTEAQRRAYLQRYKDEQNIEINYDNVHENNALREICKLTLNNLWGYFGKSPNGGKTVFISSYANYLKLIHNKTIKVTATYLVNKNMMAVEYKTVEKYEKPDLKTNTPIACFTTAFARLQLLGQMEKLNHRVLYFDTDSIIYIDRVGEPGLDSGPLLGQLTDEILEKYGDKAKISKFCAGGPKTYMLQIVDKDTGLPIDCIMKHKGIMPTVNNADVLSPAGMSHMIENNSPLLVEQRIFTRNRRVGTVQTKHMKKMLRVTFSKRIIPDACDALSLPIGYKD